MERGLVDVNAQVRDYWPEFGSNGKEKITVKDLLCHTAGMFGFKGGIPVNNWTDWRQYTRLLASKRVYWRQSVQLFTGIPPLNPNIPAV